jgi:hypothetical protein
MNDIDCSDTVNWNGGAGFEPIGTSPSRFIGTFNGQNHIITGLYINRPFEMYIGLFGFADGAEIKNVGLEDVDINGQHSVGALVGFNVGGKITNSYATGSVNISGSGNSHTIGGLIGCVQGGTIENCYAEVNVTSYSNNWGGTGGLVGYLIAGTIKNCYATGTVGNGWFVGGLVGYNPNGTIENSFATGSVTGNSNVGGLVGNNDGTITNCYYNNHAGNPSVGIGSGSGDCTAIGNNESYFYYSSNPPMSSWDFVNIWGIDEGVSHPYLLWQPPSIIYVDADATGGANNGTSWSDAYLHLKDALANANSNPDIDDIRVAEGTYNPDANTANPDGTGDREATFRLLNGTGLYGGFPTGGSYWENRDTSAYPTILSGDLDGNDVQGLDPCDLLDEPTRGENSYHVVIGSGTDHNAVLDGFTITAGNANGSDPHGWGGGMCNANESSPTVTNCTFSGNSACAGGGMCNDSSSPTVTNCTFSGNTASADGGGMNNENSSPMVSNCAFIGNSTEDGGGMCNYSSSPTVTNCTFTGNSAISPDVHVLGGGGMCNVEYSSPTVTNCILWGNSSPEPNGPQIALKDNSTISISYCDLQGGQTAIYKVGTNNSVIWGEGNIDEDPLFIDANGLDGIGGTADDEDDNVHLFGYSPCINAGDPGCDYSGQVDIDRQPRVAYGRVDMGADEVFPAAGDFEPDGDVDFADFAIFANHWLLGAE